MSVNAVQVLDRERQNNWKKCVHQLRLPNASYSAGVGHQRFLGEHAKPSNMIRFRKPLEQSC